MALAGLATLGAFWNMLKVRRVLLLFSRTLTSTVAEPSHWQHLEPPTVFLVVGFKDFLLPFLFFSLLGNPLPSDITSGSKLSAAQQLLALLAVGACQLADWWPQAAATSVEQGEGRAKEG